MILFSQRKACIMAYIGIKTLMPFVIFFIVVLIVLKIGLD